MNNNITLTNKHLPLQKQYSKTADQLFFGLTNQILPSIVEKAKCTFQEALDIYSNNFQIIEWKTSIQRIEEATLFQLSQSTLKSIFIRIECNSNTFKENGSFHSEQWKQLISVVEGARKFSIIISLEPQTKFSQQILNGFFEVKESLFSKTVLLECQHNSWKNPEAIKLLSGGKIKIVQRDTPTLTGFNIKIKNYDKKLCYLRLLGRNQINWFSNEISLKNAYEYTSKELIEISNSIQDFKDNYDKVYVIAANYPPSIALSNTKELIKFSK